MPWADTSLDVSTGRSDGADLNAVSHAFGGVAESGTVVMISGPRTPRPSTSSRTTTSSWCRRRTSAGDYESAWSKVRYAFGKGAMPRTVNFITGPSRSATSSRRCCSARTGRAACISSWCGIRLDQRRALAGLGGIRCRARASRDPAGRRSSPRGGPCGGLAGRPAVRARLPPRPGPRLEGSGGGAARPRRGGRCS